MNTTTYKLYNILVEQGVDKDLAAEALEEYLTRKEAEQTLATKADIALVHQSINRMGFTVVGTVLAGVAVLLQILG